MSRIFASVCVKCRSANSDGPSCSSDARRCLRPPQSPSTAPPGPGLAIEWDANYGQQWLGPLTASSPGLSDVRLATSLKYFQLKKTCGAAAPTRTTCSSSQLLVRVVVYQDHVMSVYECMQSNIYTSTQYQHSHMQVCTGLAHCAQLKHVCLNVNKVK